MAMDKVAKEVDYKFIDDDESDIDYDMASIPGYEIENLLAQTNLFVSPTTILEAHEDHNAPGSSRNVNQYPNNEQDIYRQNLSTDRIMGTHRWGKFKLLMWKNWIIQLRHKLQTIVEILIPVAFSALLILIRSLVDPEEFPNPTFYDSIPIDNLDTLQNVTLKSKVDYALAYAPSGPAINSLMEKAASYLNLRLEPRPNGTDMENYVLRYNTIAGVLFNSTLANATTLPNQLHYTLRFPSELRTFAGNPLSFNWRTDMLFPIFQAAGPRAPLEVGGGVPPGYYAEGFAAIQHSIGQAFIALKNNTADYFLSDLHIQRYPYPPYTYDILLAGLDSFISLIILLSFVYPCINTVKFITNEKEKQLKETMKIMGLENWLHWTAWFIKSMLFMVISSVLIIILLKVSWYPDTDVSVFTESSWSALLVFFILYAMATTTYCFMLSVFFSKANTAASVAGLIWFIFFAPYSFTQQNYEHMTLAQKLAVCLFSNTAMGYNFKLVIWHEGAGSGLQWHNLFQPVSIDDDFTIGYIWIMLFIDTLIYLFIALYFEKIFPGEFGVPEPWYFIFSKHFWCGPADYTEEDDLNMTFQNNDNIESEPKYKHAGIRVKNLRKIYGNKKVAVQGLTMNMYEDQITVLLGHNGAGKTTTMSMLTGMFPPTSGTAIINGKSIRTDINGVRDSLGLCPQHNVLFDELTVREHIIFFSKLKGLNNSDIEKEIIKYVNLLELDLKINAQASTLSGGMKRKLSVAVALCGGSKVVLCDEPTSGMDPSARRALWDVLQEEKKGRTILLSTHFMDEADILGDRIAIMSDGELKCCGTSFYLKKKFGIGYHLICVKTEKCNTESITKLLLNYVPDIKAESDIGSELAYQLSENYLKRFPTMLVDLENNQYNLGISSFGISLTTLEEVFMRVGTDKKEESDEIGNVNNAMNDLNGNINESTLSITEQNTPELLDGSKLIRNQFEAMFRKKLYYTIRNWTLFFIQNFVPVVFLILTIIVVRAFFGGIDLPPLDITLDSYVNTMTILEKQSNLSSVNNDRYRVANEYQNMFYYMPDRMRLTTIASDLGSYILKLSETILTTINSEYLISATISENKLIAWFNNQAYHTVPLTINTIHNAVLRSTCGPDCSLDVTNHPLPFTEESRLYMIQAGNNMGFQLSSNIGFAMGFVSAFYVLFYVKERECRAKLLQFVSGVNVFTFWITALIWDLLTFAFTSLIVVFTLFVFQEKGWHSFHELGRCYLLLITFGWSMLPLHYLSSMMFTLPSTGFTRMTMFNIFTGVGFFTIVFIMSADIFDIRHVADALTWVGLIFPHFALTHGFSNLNIMNAFNDICQSACDRISEQCTPQFLCVYANMTICCDTDHLAWKAPGIGRNVTYMIVTGIVFFSLLLIKEYDIFKEAMYFSRKIYQSSLPPESEDGIVDDDVRAEKNKILSMPQKEIQKYNLIMKEMTKYYKSFLAVNRLCVGVKHSECFGLLGINGAGKTSTFKMLTGDEKISNGEAWIKGISLKTDMLHVHKEIGYCPQFDALIDDLTGRETLNIYCLLRGIPKKRIRDTSIRLAMELNFLKHIDKKVKEYSGGNKRKLSTAVALIGSPSVVYLDEPTTGMDPGAKRHLWNVVCKVRNSGKSIILTSHYMEECEALCTRLAIMVNGEFKCIGSSQHLKNKFSQGLTLTIKTIKPTQDYSFGNGSVILNPQNISTLDIYGDQKVIVNNVKEYIAQHFQGANLKEEYQGVLTYFIPTNNFKWSAIFAIMENAKENLNIEDYAISQTSLEQIFLTFAKHQREEVKQQINK